VDKLSALGFERGHSLDTWESLEVHKGDATLKVRLKYVHHDHGAGRRPRSPGTAGALRPGYGQSNWANY
jgi:hypothetical protein